MPGNRQLDAPYTGWYMRYRRKRLQNPNSRNGHRYNIWMRQDLHYAIQRFAEDNDTTMSFVLTVASEEYLAKHLGVE
jgi:hypothetical protein